MRCINSGFCQLWTSAVLSPYSRYVVTIILCFALSVSCSVLSDGTRGSEASTRAQCGVLGCVITDRWVWDFLDILFGHGGWLAWPLPFTCHLKLLILSLGENVNEFFFRVASLAFETSVLAELEKSGSRQIGEVVSEYPPLEPRQLRHLGHF